MTNTCIRKAASYKHLLGAFPLGRCYSSLPVTLYATIGLGRMTQWHLWLHKSHEWISTQKLGAERQFRKWKEDKAVHLNLKPSRTETRTLQGQQTKTNRDIRYCWQAGVDRRYLIISQILPVCMEDILTHNSDKHVWASQVLFEPYVNIHREGEKIRSHFKMGFKFWSVQGLHNVCSESWLKLHVSPCIHGDEIWCQSGHGEVEAGFVWC